MPRASRTAVVVGLTAVGLAVIGLSILLYATYVGVRDASVVRYLYPTLTHDALVVMVPAILLMAGLLAGAALVLARKDAGRSALVWLCGAGGVVALLLSFAHALLLRNWEFGVWIGPPEWIGGVGALLALTSLFGAAVSLGIPAARQAFEEITAAPSVTSAGPPLTPAPLRAAAPRFVLGGAHSLGGLVAPIVLTTGEVMDSAATVVYFVIVGGGIVAGTIGAYLASVAARARLRNAANGGRAAGALMLFMQLIVLYQGTLYAVHDVHGGLRIGAVTLAVLVLGVVATLGGFAGLADPRSERFLRDQAEPQQLRWTPVARRPEDDPAPVDGYTVP